MLIKLNKFIWRCKREYIVVNIATTQFRVKNFTGNFIIGESKASRVDSTTLRGVNFAEKMKFYNWRIAIARDGQKQARKTSDRSALSSRTSASLSCITMSYMWHIYCPGFPRPSSPRALKGSLAQSTVGRISVRKGQESLSGLPHDLSLCPSPKVIFAGSATVTEKYELSLWEAFGERASISRDTRTCR